MKVEVLKALQYSDEHLNFYSHKVGEVIDLPSRFVQHALKNREVKPFKAQDVEIKSNNRTSGRTRNANRTKSEPKDNEHG
jgi:hypothetical protein